MSFGARIALLGLLVFSPLVFSPLGARAQDVERDAQHRPVPDYGRAPPPEEPAEALLWIPRIVFVPVHLALEYLVRRPIGWLLRTIELERLDTVFTGGGMPQLSEPDALWSFALIFRYDYGRQPSAGLGFEVHDAPERLRLRLGFSFWGDEQVRGRLRASAHLGSTEIALEGLGSLRSDGLFHGLGWDAPRSPRARYEEARGVGALSVTGRPWRRSAVTSGVRVGVHRFDDSPFHQGEDVSIDRAIASGLIEAPPGYREGYTAVETFFRVVLDSREDGGWVHASGVRAELYAGWGIDVEHGDASWVKAHSELELALEVMPDRTVALRSVVALVEALGPLPTPFTEQVWLGGEMDRMPGFLPGRLIGQSAATLGLVWRYAIWPWIDAALFVDVGNVFAAHFDDFEPERLRLSFGTALMARDQADFTLLFALGTEPFARGTDVSSLRFLISIGAY